MLAEKKVQSSDSGIELQRMLFRSMMKEMEVKDERMKDEIKNEILTAKYAEEDVIPLDLQNDSSGPTLHSLSVIKT